MKPCIKTDMKRSTLVCAVAIAATLLLSAAPSLAHETKGPNGGRVADAGSHHVELVAKETRVELYVSDAEEKPVPATGFKAVAILTAGGKPQRIVLEAVEPARLSGNASVPLPKQPKGAVQLTSPDGKTVSARFN
jgi:hypothetical protein